MANLHIGEYADIGSTTRGSIPIPLEPPKCEQSVEITSQSVQSDTLSSDTCIVVLVADVDCVISVGTDPDATTSTRYLAAGREKIMTVAQGTQLKIAVAGKGSGSMHDSLGAFLSVVSNPVEAKKNLDALAAQSATVDKSAKALRDAADANKQAKRDADKAVALAAEAQAEHDARAKSLEIASVDLRNAKAAHEARVLADKVDADERAARALAFEHATSKTAAAVAGRQREIDGAAGALAAREQAVQAREEAAVALKVEYEARIAKLKALTA